MKMVKSLLLGSAAGLIAVTAGQAAELPVKAKPVEYVKVCSLYGAGFYYMPGTDMCIKIGGWVRAELTYGMNNSMTWGAYSGNQNNRTTNEIGERARGYITADAREQTAYGTARGYIAVGISSSDFGFQESTANGFSAFSSNRAFVQWAGMTAGLAQSFYDFYSLPAANYRAGNIPASDTGDGGWWVWGYTAQLGGGFSATLAAEDRRTTQIIDNNCAFQSLTACGTVTPGGYPTLAAGLSANGGAYGGWQAPDIVANLRVDQAWGSAQIMGALHDINATYYSDTLNALSTSNTPGVTYGTADGHPGDQWGFAIGAGLKVLFPTVAQGDYFQSQFNYSEGALRYNIDTPNTNWGKLDGNKEAYGVLSDCVYGGTLDTATTTSCKLTTAWGFNASYEHYWTPQWHESFTGWYTAVSYGNGQGSGNAMLCVDAKDGNGLAGSLALALPGCNNNWDVWGLGSRLQWDVTKSFYLGVEVLYENLQSAKTSDGLTHGYAYGLANQAIFTEADSNDWIVTIRAHKDFLP